MVTEHGWSNSYAALIVVREGERQVVQVGLRTPATYQDMTNWGLVMAGAIVAVLPAMAVFVLL